MFLLYYYFIWPVHISSALTRGPVQHRSGREHFVFGSVFLVQSFDFWKRRQTAIASHSKSIVFQDRIKISLSLSFSLHLVPVTISNRLIQLECQTDVVFEIFSRSGPIPIMAWSVYFKWDILFDFGWIDAMMHTQTHTQTWGGYRQMVEKWQWGWYCSNIPTNVNKHMYK